MGVFSDSWEITKATLRVLRSDKELFVYPLITVILLVIYTILFAGITFWIMTTTTAFENDILAYILIISGSFIYYLGSSIISTFCNMCIVYTAKNRFEGLNATISSSLAFGLSRFSQIVLWSLLNASVGTLLMVADNFLRKIGGIGGIILRWLRGFLGFAWNILKIFTIPVMVYENTTPLNSLKRSAQIIRQKWGETIVLGIGFSALTIILFIPAIVLVFGFLFYAVFVVYSQALMSFIPFILGGLFIYYIFLILLTSILENIYRTAIYVYATTGKIPANYTQEQLESALKQTNESN